MSAPSLKVLDARRYAALGMFSACMATGIAAGVYHQPGLVFITAALAGINAQTYFKAKKARSEVISQRTCESCRWFEDCGRFAGLDLSECHAPRRNDAQSHFSEHQRKWRMDKGVRTCGPSGRWWEAKEPAVVPIKVTAQGLSPAAAIMAAQAAVKHPCEVCGIGTDRVWKDSIGSSYYLCSTACAHSFNTFINQGVQPNGISRSPSSQAQSGPAQNSGGGGSAGTGSSGQAAQAPIGSGSPTISGNLTIGTGRHLGSNGAPAGVVNPTGKGSGQVVVSSGAIGPTGMGNPPPPILSPQQVAAAAKAFKKSFKAGSILPGAITYVGASASAPCASCGVSTAHTAFGMPLCKSCQSSVQMTTANIAPSTITKYAICGRCGHEMRYQGAKPPCPACGHGAYGDETTPLESETRFGEIKAYRCWRIYNGHLRSMSADWFWAPHSTMRAGIPSGKDGSDDVRSHWQQTDLGIHAFKDVHHALQYISAHQGDSWCAYGEVLLWGEVFEHEIGYQAEYAKISKVLGVWRGAGGTDEAELLKSLRAQYDLPEAA